MKDSATQYAALCLSCFALGFACGTLPGVVTRNPKPETVIKAIQSEGFRIYDADGFEVDRIEFDNSGNWSHWTK